MAQVGTTRTSTVDDDPLLLQIHEEILPEWRRQAGDDDRPVIDALAIDFHNSTRPQQAIGFSMQHEAITYSVIDVSCVPFFSGVGQLAMSGDLGTKPEFTIFNHGVLMNHLSLTSPDFEDTDLFPPTVAFRHDRDGGFEVFRARTRLVGEVSLARTVRPEHQHLLGLAGRTVGLTGNNQETYGTVERSVASFTRLQLREALEGTVFHAQDDHLRFVTPITNRSSFRNMQILESLYSGDFVMAMRIAGVEEVTDPEATKLFFEALQGEIAETPSNEMLGRVDDLILDMSDNLVATVQRFFEGISDDSPRDDIESLVLTRLMDRRRADYKPPTLSLKDVEEGIARATFAKMIGQSYRGARGKSGRGKRRR